MRITMQGKTVAPAPVPPPPTPPQRAWPYSPDEPTLMQWLNTALWHYAGIRATGSVPDVGGPSAQILNPATATAAIFRAAAETAEEFWPNARSFDLIGGDLLYKEAGTDQTSDPDALPGGVNRLRNAAVITTFTVTDRGEVKTPAAANNSSGLNPQDEPASDTVTGPAIDTTA
jgi:hypothetical protein